MIKVLLVDDESWNRDIVRTFGSWEEHGMEIAGEAEDGREALRLTDELSPQIVITDMRMPGADGVMLMNNLHARYPEIKVIVVSGYDDFKYAQNAVRYGAVDYLLKPVDPKELNAVLDKCRRELEEAERGQKAYALDIDVSLCLSSYKQLMRVHFNELNAEGVNSVLEGIRRELELGGAKGPGALRQAANEMLLLLKELMRGNRLEDELLKAEISHEALASAANVEAYLKALYGAALELLIGQRKFKNKLKLDEVRLYIDGHFAEAVTLDGLARAFFVSKEYLSKVFKQEYGCNVTDYILGLRMEKAKEWLADENIPIKTVAELAGYEDVGYFYRVFKKHYGVAPGEMRKQNSSLKMSNSEG
ncbi:response regulator transcription factor [Paenibacillus riograndensis]|uniref:Chemotaxis protein CheY n=2 Tax=Paenibacillus riograndensis TaxID=483937 RepID=A0A0E4CVN5_9BACL|nr:response regulator [Paenibacillus riograndensis]CQR54389.1 chemotaxis protein CheY [Paenibacillus riograndensis SBR5]